MAWSKEGCQDEVVEVVWFHLKLDDFSDAEIPQLVECFFPRKGGGVLQTTLFQAFEMKEQPSTEPQEVSRGLQNICVPSGSPSSRFRTECQEEFPSSFWVDKPFFLPLLLMK